MMFANAKHAALLEIVLSQEIARQSMLNNTISPMILNQISHTRNKILPSCASSSAVIGSMMGRIPNNDAMAILNQSSSIVHQSFRDREVNSCGKIFEKLSADERVYIDRVRDADVLCGRGGRTNRHPGNKNYRDMVNETKITYRNTRSQNEKATLSRMVTDHVRSQGGRFVKFDEKTGRYYALTPEEARRKTSQALREQKDGELNQAPNIIKEERDQKKSATQDENESMKESLPQERKDEELAYRAASPTKDNNDKRKKLSKISSSPPLKKRKIIHSDKIKIQNRVYVDCVYDFDVLCGRGGRTNHHPGNKRYRQIVNEMKKVYRNIGEKAKKTDFSQQIVDHVSNYGGRFINKDEKSQRYYLLSHTEARKKTSQALRES